MITLATLKDATAQQVFDQVVAHLRKQNKRSIDSDGLCAYRGEDGLMCAAGCLISDEEYLPEMDSMPFTNSWTDQVKRGFFPWSHKSLIVQLQMIHDKSQPENWEKSFKLVAEGFSLKYSAPV